MQDVDKPRGLVLAGGLARRFGGLDKALMQLGHGVTLLDTLVGRLAPQCASLVVSANGDASRFGASRLPVVPDAPGPSRGPLAGVLAGLAGAAEREGDAPWLLTVPGDTPFIPHDLARRLLTAALEMRQPVARACHRGRRHSLVALWSPALHAPLRDALHGRDLRKVTAFQAEVGVVDVNWDEAPDDPFFNINTPEDLASAHAMLERGFLSAR